MGKNYYARGLEYSVRPKAQSFPIRTDLCPLSSDSIFLNSGSIFFTTQGYLQLTL